jgi:hypothetical protein
VLAVANGMIEGASREIHCRQRRDICGTERGTRNKDNIRQTQVKVGKKVRDSGIGRTAGVIELEG